jgi:hypothetical protein
MGMPIQLLDAGFAADAVWLNRDIALHSALGSQPFGKGDTRECDKETVSLLDTPDSLHSLRAIPESVRPGGQV